VVATCKLKKVACCQRHTKNCNVGHSDVSSIPRHVTEARMLRSVGRLLGLRNRLKLILTSLNVANALSTPTICYEYCFSNACRPVSLDTFWNLSNRLIEFLDRTVDSIDDDNHYAFWRVVSELLCLADFFRIYMCIVCNFACWYCRDSAIPSLSSINEQYSFISDTLARTDQDYLTRETYLHVRNAFKAR